MKKALISILILFALITHQKLSKCQEWVDITPFPDNTYAISGSFVSDSVGWVFSALSDTLKTLYYTTNGGASFDSIYTLEDDSAKIYKLQMNDELNGYYSKRVRIPNALYGESSYLMRTSDGGKTWVEVIAFDSIINGTDYIDSYSSFYFITPEVGFIGAGDTSIIGGVIYKTIDAGKTWQKVTTPINGNNSDLFTSYYVRKFFFFNKDIGWAACSTLGTGLILYTNDGGNNWELVCNYVPAFDIHFITPDIGGFAGACSYGSNVVLTENNFQDTLFRAWEWEQGSTAYALAFQNDSTIWVTGSGGYIYKSMNGGKSFSLFQETDNHSGQNIIFFNNIGYIIGFSKIYKFNGESTGFYHRSPGEMSITIFPNPGSTNIHVDFNKKQNGRVYILSMKGDVLINKTINTEQNISIDIASLLPGTYLIKFVNKKECYVNKFIKINN